MEMKRRIQRLLKPNERKPRRGKKNIEKSKKSERR